jgi:hypothetical protein
MEACSKSPTSCDQTNSTHSADTFLDGFLGLSLPDLADRLLYLDAGEVFVRMEVLLVMGHVRLLLTILWLVVSSCAGARGRGFVGQEGSRTAVRSATTDKREGVEVKGEPY